VTYYILAAQTIHFEFYIEQNKFLPISRDQWELGAETKHYIFWRILFVYNRTTSARLSGSFRPYAYTSSTTCVVKRLIYYRLQFSTRVRLSGSVEIVNLTTASSTLQSSYQSLTNPYFLLPVEDEGLEGRFSGNTT